MSSNKKRLQLSASQKAYGAMLIILVLVLAGLLAGAYQINTLLTKQSTKLVGLKAQTMALSQEQAGLARAKKDIAQNASLETVAKAIVPEDKDQAEAVREIVNIAGASNIALDSISFPSSTLGSAAPAPVATSGKTTTIKPATALSQLTAVPGIAGVYSLPITITNGADNPVTYQALYNFLSQLEQNRRTAQVTTLSIQPLTAAPSQLTFTLTINEYIKP